MPSEASVVVGCVTALRPLEVVMGLDLDLSLVFTTLDDASFLLVTVVLDLTSILTLHCPWRSCTNSIPSSLSSLSLRLWFIPSVGVVVVVVEVEVEVEVVVDVDVDVFLFHSPMNPPRDPSLAMTRWQGTAGAKGLQRSAPPTARGEEPRTRARAA